MPCAKKRRKSSQRLNQTGAGQADLTTDANGYTLSLKIPFANDDDLRNRLVNLAAAIPARSDWALVRAALVPAAVGIVHDRRQRFLAASHYHEQVDLSRGAGGNAKHLNEMSATLGKLSTASPDDQEAQLQTGARESTPSSGGTNRLGALTLDYELDAGAA